MRRHCSLTSGTECLLLLDGLRQGRSKHEGNPHEALLSRLHLRRRLEEKRLRLRRLRHDRSAAQD